MTRDEIISGLKFTIEMFLLNPSTGEKYTEPRNDMDNTTIEACRGAIKLLDQEPILDKIRAEIDRARFIDKDTRHCRNALASGLEVALQIIDKYKAESEG